ncbi:MAG TPA: hypothetical protein VF329_03495 [Gammaproteobacteria bacterium]
MANVVGVYEGATTADAAAHELSDVTIPAGATTAFIGLTKWGGTEGPFSAVSLDGEDAQFVDGFTTFESASEIHVYRASGFTSGPNKTLSFTLAGAAADGVPVVIAFVNDEDTSDPVLASDAVAAATSDQTATTEVLPCGSDGLLLSFCAADVAADEFWRWPGCCRWPGKWTVKRDGHAVHYGGGPGSSGCAIRHRRFPCNRRHLCAAGCGGRDRHRVGHSIRAGRTGCGGRVRFLPLDPATGQVISEAARRRLAQEAAKKNPAEAGSKGT